MKSTIPRKIIDPCGSFEKGDRPTRWGRRAAGDEFRDARDFEIVEPADQSTFEALIEKFFEHSSFRILL